MDIASLSFSNFRSFTDPAFIPFTNKITILVGPNNVGKTNVLRLLSLLFNSYAGAKLPFDNLLDFPDANKSVSVKLTLSKAAAIASLQRRHTRIVDLLRNALTSSFELECKLDEKGLHSFASPSFEKMVGANFFRQQNDFLSDFATYSTDPRANLSTALTALNLQQHLIGTVYVPSIRFITTPGNEPPHFSNTPFAGTTISNSQVVQSLADMDRPNHAQLKLRDNLKSICDFLSYCLEEKTVQIQVPRDTSTILVRVGENEMPISNVGTGIHQLIIMALGSFGFENKMVLIDEPELHLHPRTQKRLMSYLHERAMSKLIIATHSAAIVDACPSNVIQIEQYGKAARARLVGNLGTKYEAIRALGHSPSELVLTNFVIWVEGPSDRIYLNHWIKQIDADVKEGTDYSILFYGGKVLSQHHFADSDENLVYAISVARRFAVVMDRDRGDGQLDVNKTKSRIIAEAEKVGGFAWVTAGREIENYVPNEIWKSLSNDALNSDAGQFEHVIASDGVNKVKLAEQVCSLDNKNWNFDLSDKISELVALIRQAR